MLIAAIIAVAAGGSAALLLRKPAASSGGFLGQVASTVNFPLYTPAWLPEGWFLDRQSLSVTSEVVTFTVNDTKGQRLVFTEQPRPPQDNLDTFYNQQLSGATTSNSAAGAIVIGQFEGSSLAGVSAEQTWVLIRAVSMVDQEDFGRLVGSLQKARQN